MDAPDQPPPSTIPVRPGEQLDWDRLDRFLTAKVPDLGQLTAIEQFSIGRANLTYLLHYSNQRVVVRRPPFGALPLGGHDMRREYKALAGLATVTEIVARPLVYEEDPAVIGAPFFAMEYREGVVIDEALPASLRHLPDAGHRVGMAVVDALAEIHTLDPAQAGLEDLGRPAGYLERQVVGWLRRWESVSEVGGEIPDVAQVGEALRSGLPPLQRVSILHNDYKLDNCQFAPAEPDRVITIFDWDMATLGDPLADVGTLLNYWPDDHGEFAGPTGLRSMALPSHDEALEHYAARTGLDVGGIRWYCAFACWKTAVAIRQLVARRQRGESADDRIETHAASVAVFAARGRRILEERR